MNILDRDILKYALLVIIGFWICKLFLNSHEGFTCEEYLENIDRGGSCSGDPNNPSEDCCNGIKDLPGDRICWAQKGRGHLGNQTELNQRIDHCRQGSDNWNQVEEIPQDMPQDMPHDSSVAVEEIATTPCFTPDSEYTFGRCCDQSIGPAGDTTCWGGGYGFVHCCNLFHPLYKLMNHYDTNRTKSLDINEVLLILTDITGDDGTYTEPEDTDGDGIIESEEFIDNIHSGVNISINILRGAGIDTSKQEFNLSDLELLVNYLRGLGYPISNFVNSL